MEQQPFKAIQVYEVLQQYMRQRPELGISKGLSDLALESSNPFDSKSKRLPKRWFALSVLLAASASSCFIYFNSLW